jgi:hypothetical protein
LENGSATEPPPGSGERRAISSGETEATQLNRKMLLDLRDALRSFLTLLETK